MICLVGCKSFASLFAACSSVETKGEITASAEVNQRAQYQNKQDERCVYVLHGDDLERIHVGFIVSGLSVYTPGRDPLPRDIGIILSATSILGC